MLATNTRQSRNLIAFYNYFRIVIAAILIGITSLSDSRGFVGNQLLFITLSSSYVFACIFQLFQSRSRQHNFSSLNLTIAILLDEAFILALIFLSSGVSTGLGILLITPISIAGIFFTGNRATIFAAFAALGILSNHLYLIFVEAAKDRDEIQIGMLGMTFFITSLGVQYLSRYIKSAQENAVEAELKAQLLTELNQHIVQRIRTGVIIFDDNEQLILTNKAADQLLSTSTNPALVANEIKQLLRQWQIHNSNNHKLSHDSLPIDIQVNFSALDNIGHIITFIDDLSELTQQALQLKLASLGRLSASIAHEIRNPLNAISHSVQLLEESPDIHDKADLRLLNIANNHIKRIDDIIKNILGMSRQKNYQPQKINLLEFIDNLKDEYNNNLNYPDLEFITDIETSNIIAPFDKSQLQQILINLIDNALRYSQKHSATYWVKLELKYEEDKAILNIYDKGIGVAEENKAKLFEPFYTSETTGTGLGLYLSRELCTLNQSQLSYIHKDGSDHHFQIRFAHADRDILMKTNNNHSE